MTAARSATRSGVGAWSDWFRLAFQAVTLNALWLVGCALVVSAPAATTALVAGVHRWRVTGEEPTARRFLRDVRERLWRDLALGLIVIGIVAFAAFDLLIIGQMGEERRTVLVLWIASIAAIAIATVFTAVASSRILLDGNPRTPPWRVLTLSTKMAATRPLPAVAGLVAIVGAAVLVTTSPICLLGAGVVVAALLDRLAERRVPAP